MLVSVLYRRAYVGNWDVLYGMKGQVGVLSCCHDYCVCR